MKYALSSTLYNTASLETIDPEDWTLSGNHYDTLEGAVKSAAEWLTRSARNGFFPAVRIVCVYSTGETR